MSSANKKRKNMKSNKESIWLRVAQTFMAFIPFFFGLSYDFTVFITLFALLTFLLVFFLKTGSITVWTGKGFTAVLCWMIGNLIAIFFSVEKGVAIWGFCKWMIVPVWILILMQFAKKEQEKILSVIPYSATVMTVICMLLCRTILRPYLFDGERMGGFFQYSNTFALFLLMGILLLINQWKNQTSQYVMIGIMITGILWSGSRTTFLFMITAFLIHACSKKELRKPVVIFTAGVIVIGILTVVISGSTEGIGRFMTISLSSSTFVGRILYAVDSLPILLKHPFGLGYLGYYFMEPVIQHGVYNVRFIHNDWLQFALDGGWISICAVGYLVIRNIRMQWKDNRIASALLILISLHMCFEFDMTFFSIMMCFLLCMDWKNGKRIDVKWQIGKSIPIALPMLIAVWLAVAAGLEYAEKNEASLAVYPWNSEVQTKVMMACNNSSDAEIYADNILKANEYSYAAYNVKAVAAKDRGDYMKMISYKKKALDITRYSLAEYQDYVLMLAIAIENCQKIGDSENEQKCIAALLEVENILNNIEEETHPLAYKIKDVPQFELPVEYIEYINSFK